MILGSRRATLVLAGALVASVGVVPGTASAATPTCFGKQATIVGTNTGERIVGTPDADVIVAKGGDDTIFGRGGRDRICGGGGKDTLVGARGRDRLKGGRGADNFFGGQGSDVMISGQGSFHVMFGGPGDDFYNGFGSPFDFAAFTNARNPVNANLANNVATGQGNDTLKDIEGLAGSEMADTLTGDRAPNFIFGDQGNDTISLSGVPAGSSESDFAEGGPGNDRITGSNAFDVVTYLAAPSGVTVDLQSGTVSGGEGNDTLLSIEGVDGSGFADTLSGSADDDAFQGNGGADTIDGRMGDDVLVYFSAGGGVTVDLGAGTASGGGAGNDSLISVEDVIGSSFADTITGNDVGNFLGGGGGNDVLSGLAGGDALIGDAGNDTADGGDGTDVCDAESEINCEQDPVTTSARALGVRSPYMSVMRTLPMRALHAI